MQLTILIQIKYLKILRIIFTEVVLVNWFVAWVNCANDDACNLILFDVVIGRFVVKDIKYSRTFAMEFKFLLNSIKADWFNGVDVYLKK